MDTKLILSEIQKRMRCRNCGYRVVQSQIRKNEGKCPCCRKKFRPLG